MCQGQPGKIPWLSPEKMAIFLHLALFFHLSLPPTSKLLFLKYKNRIIITQSVILTPSNWWFLGAFEYYLFFIIILTIISEKHYVIKQLYKRLFRNLVFSETLKGISNTLQNLTFVQPSVDEIVGWSRGPDEPPLLV